MLCCIARFSGVVRGYAGCDTGQKGPFDPSEACEPVGEFNGVHLLAAGKLLEEAGRVLEALALQDGKNIDLQGLWISCKGRMVFLADALRVPPDSGKGSMLRQAERIPC